MESIKLQTPLKTYVNTRKIAPKKTPKPIRTDTEPQLLKREPLTTKKAVEFLLAGTLKYKVCRYCLHTAFPLMELDQYMQIAGRGALYSITIRDIIATVHPFKVIDDPNFPNKICNKCLNNAIRSYLFAQQCEQAERALRNCFDDMFEKLEKLDPIERTKKRGRQKLNPNHNVLYTEHRKVMDYAEPIRNLINSGSVSFTKETEMSNLECKKCWQVLPNIESLVNHEKIHPKSMWYHCRVCGKSFAKRNQINKHLRTHEKSKQIAVPENSFECKQCNYISENYNEHLQHIEKHKFQMVLEHLVERNMDKLCSVCFDKGKLEDLDKMVCLHGGYPELTGSRTLYNILGSTVPEKSSYKYQELFIPRNANVLTITKTTRATPEDNIESLNEEKSSFNKQFTFTMSYPLVLSTENFNCDDQYLFMFSEAQKVITAIDNIPKNDNVAITFSGIQYDIKNNDELLKHKQNYDIKYNNEAQFKDINSNEDCIANANVTTLETARPFKFIFSQPDYIKDTEEMIVKTSSNDIFDLKVEKLKLCETCRAYNIPYCTNCIETANIEETNAVDSEVMISKDNLEPVTCKYCWIFKNSSKCDYCKKSNKTIVNVQDDGSNVKCNDIKEGLTTKPKVDELDIVTYDDLHVTSNPSKVSACCTYSDTMQAIKRKNHFAVEIKPKKLKWECPVCLISNNTDRETCLCCESNSKVNKGTVKINFDYANNSFLNQYIQDVHPETEFFKKSDKNITRYDDDCITMANDTTTEKILSSDLKNNDNNITRNEDNSITMANDTTTEKILSSEMYTNTNEIETKIIIKYELPAIAANSTITENERMEVEDVENQTDANSPFIEISPQMLCPVTPLSIPMSLPNWNISPTINFESPKFQPAQVQFNIGSSTLKSPGRKKRALRRLTAASHK